MGFITDIKRPKRWVGKKTLANMKANARLKRKFEAMGITSCELHLPGCTRDSFLSWAHGKKRRKLVGNELETCVILSCVYCHQVIERLSAERMLAIVEEVIRERTVQQGNDHMLRAWKSLYQEPDACD